MYRLLQKRIVRHWAGPLCRMKWTSWRWRSLEWSGTIDPTDRNWVSDVFICYLVVCREPGPLCRTKWTSWRWRSLEWSGTIDPTDRNGVSDVFICYLVVWREAWHISQRTTRYLPLKRAMVAWSAAILCSDTMCVDGINGVVTTARWSNKNYWSCDF